MSSRLFIVSGTILLSLSTCYLQHGSNSSDYNDADSMLVSKQDSIISEMNEEQKDVNSIPVSVDELFDDFIYSFSNSQGFQRRRIAFPLHVNNFGEDIVVTKQEWEHRDFFKKRDYYTVFYNRPEDCDQEHNAQVEHIEFETINLIKGEVCSCNFDRQDGHWMLTRETITMLRDHKLAEFLNFYQLFVVDSLRPHNSVAKSIRYITTDPDDDFNTIEGTLESDQWSSFEPELPTDYITHINYGQSFTDSTHVTLHKCGIANGMLDELGFIRTNQGWQLTSFSSY